MNTLKIRSVTLRYEGHRGWPWTLVYDGVRGISSLSFAFRRDAIRFAHDREWKITDSTDKETASEFP